MKTVAGGSCAVLLALMMDGHALNAAASCENLSSLALPNASITLAQMVPAGGLSLPGTVPAVPQFSQLPAFCRVAATLAPSSDSDIKIEVWLPALAWNGKFQAVGNSGWAGNISYGALASALHEGYATASTDTGHVGANASFAIKHPEKVIDFAYRAVHEMAVKSKAVIAAFYDRAPRFSYWTGCSTGGRQALMEAQRYPEDFDGILAGAPANNQTQLCAWRIAVEARILQEPASVVPRSKLAMLTSANPEPGGIDVGMFRYVAHEDPAWDWRTFDLDRDTSPDRQESWLHRRRESVSFGLSGSRWKISHLPWLE
jgi:feruloyl esterase